MATEHQLLEANRLRLLNQRDWVGLAAQRPAKIQFASIREKDRIGKRRKIKAQRGQQPRLEEDITWAPRYETHDNLPGRHMSGGLRNDIKDIRIRVGTGALGTETSAPQSDYAAEEQAEANREQLSDPMLFDQEETYTSPQVSRQRPRSVNNHQTASAGQMTRPGPEAYPEFSLSDGDRSHETSKDHTSPHHDGVGLHRNQFGEADAANHNPALLQFAKHGPANAQPHSEASKSNILHIGRGGNNPLRLIVNPSFENASSMGALPDTGAVKDCDVKEGVACRQANAGLPDFGRRQRSDSEQRVSSSTNQRLPRIVDDSRWRPFVDIADISSSRSTAVLSHTRRSPQRSDGNDMLCAWSQQATVGGQTLAKVSSPISASLPLIKYSNEGGTVGHPSGIDQQGEQVASTRQSQHMDESERLWRTFVFADEEGVVSEGQSTRECCTDTQSDSPVISLQPAGTLPSDSTDALLSSMNSMLPTFPNSAASAKLRMTDKARAVERCSTSMARPGSRYPSAGSSIAGRSIEGRTTALSSMQQRHNGVLRSEERRDFGCSEGVSVTQSSLFNDVSHDTFSSGTFGSGLDR